jgi:hypothetical protein
MSDGGLLCPCNFFVPTAYNDGRAVEPEVRLRIHMALIRQFEAYTLLPEVQGLWRGQGESHDHYLIAVPQSRVEELKKVVASIGRELGQKQMYFQAGPPSVSMLEIEDTTPPLAG